MSNTKIDIRDIQFKRGIKAVLEAKLVPEKLGIPKSGEPIYETDTGKLKIGDGKKAYKDLPYLGEKEFDLSTFEFECASDEYIEGVVWRVLWLERPTEMNSVKGFTICKKTGRLYEVYKNAETYSLQRYVTDDDIIQTEDITLLLQNLG